jgi:hypothetical protein
MDPRSNAEGTHPQAMAEWLLPSGIWNSTAMDDVVD